MAYSLPFLLMCDTTTQSIAVANTAQVITLNTTINVNKIIQTSASRFTIIEAGFYIAILSPQFNLAAGTNKFINLFLKKNGTAVANSNNRWGIVSANADQTNATILIGNLAQNDFIEFWMQGDSTNLQILFISAVGGLPAVPSVVLYLYKIS